MRRSGAPTAPGRPGTGAVAAGSCAHRPPGRGRCRDGSAGRRPPAHRSRGTSSHWRRVSAPGPERPGRSGRHVPRSAGAG
ncbi:hypothetical protein ACFFX0_03795 [Citricoccus parietis]|uniref:Uncharacterized protein n=1 Tax=Citricoccus parietis TaxID=592307 RepID=A0ABV5FUJ1_9MICC